MHYISKANIATAGHLSVVLKKSGCESIIPTLILILAGNFSKLFGLLHRNLFVHVFQKQPVYSTNFHKQTTDKK